MVAILEMDNVKCACPYTNVTNDGSFWSISGISPGPIRDDVSSVRNFFFYYYYFFYFIK